MMPMMYGGGAGWAWCALGWLVLLALTVWAVVIMSGIRQEVQGVREALKEIAGRLDRSDRQ